MSGSAWDLASTSGFTASLPLSQSTIDLDVAGRSDERVVERALDDSMTRVMFVNGPRVAVWRSDGTQAPDALMCDADPAAPRPDASAPVGHLNIAFIAGPAVRTEALREGALAVYLGRDRSEDRVVRYIALDVTRLGEQTGPRYESDLLARIAADPIFGVTLEELEHIVRPEKYVGRAPWQTEEFLNETVRPILKQYEDIPAETAEINL